jgi:3-hydroxyisobutyrate dehydrogenase
MPNITVLGLGAMGSRMAANLLKVGHAVTVWNRSPNAADDLVGAGARWAATPKAAAQGADFIIAMVRDDEASRELWLAPEMGALAGVDPGAVAIESSTLTANWAPRPIGVASPSLKRQWRAPVPRQRPRNLFTSSAARKRLRSAPSQSSRPWAALSTMSDRWVRVRWSS